MSDITNHQQSTERLRESESYFRLLFEYSTDGITLIEPNGNVLHSSPSIIDILGYKREEFEGCNVFQMIHPEDLAAFSDELKRLIDEPGMIVQMQFRNRRQDGSYVWIEARIRNLLNERDVQAIVITYRDISKRKQFEEEIIRLNAELEHRVAARTAQLENANRELEAFSYSVSHDLRAPLRAIDGFTKILLEEGAEKLDDESRRHLLVISNNARQMGMLINDLLAFSRFGRQKPEQFTVDMQTLAFEVVNDLLQSVTEVAYSISVGDLPSAQGDPRLIRQVLSNLIANAMKFSRHQSQPVIEIGGRREERESIYWVKDNGVGFDMRYAGKLFGVFQRLHKPEEFEGTGVGLAIVQRIIHRHGGRVWAEAQLHRGATFYFALPPE